MKATTNALPLPLGHWRLGGALLAVVLAAASGCSEPPPASYRATELSEGVVARVGGNPIAGSTVAAVMADRRLDAHAAVEVVVEDALFAQEARERLPAPVLDQIVRSILAREVVEALWKDARSAAPTEEEVRKWTERKWYDLDHPSAARTVHAVAMAPKPPSPEKEARARAVAEQIAEAVRGAKSPEDFKSLAKAVPHDDVQVRVEDLEAVTADGRVLSSRWPPGKYDVDFAQAANALRSVGDISPVVKTRFGFHVMYLVERIPEQRASYEERSEAVRDDVYRERGKTSLERLLDERGRAVGVRVERSAEELMRRVGVE